MSPFCSPNYTQAPNDLFDDLLPVLKESELRVALVIIRLTFGFHRESARASLTVLERMTGLSRQGVLDGAKGLEERGLLVRTRDDGITEWQLLVAEDASQPTRLVNVVDQKTGKVVNPVDQSSQASRPPSIKETVKKEIKEKRAGNKFPARAGDPADPYAGLSSGDSEPTGGGNPKAGEKREPAGAGKAKRAAAPPDPRLRHPAIQLVRGVTRAYPPKATFDRVIERLGEQPDGERFATCYETWCLRGNRPTNLEGVLDWYEDGVPDAKPQRANSKAEDPGAARQSVYREL